MRMLQMGAILLQMVAMSGCAELGSREFWLGRPARGGYSGSYYYSPPPAQYYLPPDYSYLQQLQLQNTQQGQEDFYQTWQQPQQQQTWLRNQQLDQLRRQSGENLQPYYDWQQQGIKRAKDWASGNR